MLTTPCLKCLRGPRGGRHQAGCTAETRFWHRIARVGACWEWQAAMHSEGYGVFRIPNGTREGKLVYAHRFAYEGSFGAIPEGMEILHLCDNRRCVRPAHLSVGTRTDNMRDASAKGRMVPRRKGDRILPKTPAKAEADARRAAKARARWQERRALEVGT